MGQRMPSVPAAAGGRVPSPSMAAVLLSSSLVICTAELGAGKEVFVKLIKTTEARRKGKLISHGNQLDLIQKNKQRVRSVSLAGCFSGKGITRRFPPKGMALYCCSLCNWGFKSGTKSHYHKISLYGEKKKKVDIYEAQEGAAKQEESMGEGLRGAMLGAGGCQGLQCSPAFLLPWALLPAPHCPPGCMLALTSGCLGLRSLPGSTRGQRRLRAAHGAVTNVGCP